VASREPFSRHHDRGDTDRRTTGERLVAAYEFTASEYGWTPEAVEAGLSDEQLVAYLDAASDRIRRRRTDEFDSLVEAVRSGTIFAHDRRAAAKWRRATRERGNRQQRGLTGAELEAAVANVARMFPGNVMTVAA
jgi:hypothetical protein